MEIKGWLDLHIGKSVSIRINKKNLSLYRKAIDFPDAINT